MQALAFLTGLLSLAAAATRLSARMLKAFNDGYHHTDSDGSAAS